MIFTLRTQRPFRGRIYTYKHFDRSPCFVQGSGGLTHRLRIPRADSSLTNCGTESLAGGNTQTNIVVVQNSQMVQTSKDMIYNLTCTLQTPGQSVVSSGYIGAGYVRGTLFENHRKRLIQHCERSELCLHFEWTKVN